MFYMVSQLLLDLSTEELFVAIGAVVLFSVCAVVSGYKGYLLSYCSNAFWGNRQAFSIDRQQSWQGVKAVAFQWDV